MQCGGRVGVGIAKQRQSSFYHHRLLFPNHFKIISLVFGGKQTKFVIQIGEIETVRVLRLLF